MAINDWLDYLSEHGRKELTLENYRIELEKCIKTLESAERPTDANMISVEDVFFLKDNLGVSEGSTKKYLKILGAWTEWETGENIFDKADILWNPPKPKRLFITDGELDKLLSVADARETVILLLGACMGLRRAEITTVKWSDIRNGRLTIHGKGHGVEGKVAEMLIPARVQKAMNVWRVEMMELNLKDESDGCIVPGIQKGKLTQMAPTSLNPIIRSIGKRAGVTVTTHSLRRNFATTLYNRHVDLVDIKELMRHESVNTTVRCYIQADVSRLDAILDSF